jgi:hypothetical protein
MFPCLMSLVDVDVHVRGFRKGKTVTEHDLFTIRKLIPGGSA